MSKRQKEAHRWPRLLTSAQQRNAQLGLGPEPRLLLMLGYICQPNAKIIQSNMANFAGQVGYQEVDSDAGEAVSQTNEDLVGSDQLTTKGRNLMGKIIL